ncbi:MAG: ABC transporter permease [Devosia sp.]|nr:ABC transporter permease [Devosia sp.]
MAKAETPARPNPLAGFFKLEGTAIALVFFLLVLVFVVTAPRAFMGYRLYMSFMATVPPPMIIALGLTLVVVAGEMDLSFPSVVAFASYVFCILYQQYDMTWLALLAALLAGTLMGFVNGLVVTKLGIPSLIATLAMLFLWGGLTTVVSNGASLAIPQIDGTPFQQIFAGRIGGVVPVQFFWALAVAVLMWQLLNRHRFGENLLFIGDNLKVAKVVGIAVDREKIKLFTLMGMLSALAGVFLTLETTTYFSQAGMGYLLTVVAAVFIGGTSIFGGSGKVAGTVFGSLIVAIIEAGLVASGVQGFWTRFFIGLVFLISVTMNAAIEDPDKVPLLRELRSRARK